MEPLLNFLLALIGIATFSVYHAKDFISTQEWSTAKFIYDNAMQWLWSVVMAFLAVVLIAIVPDGGEAFKALTGLDLSNSPMAFFTLGVTLSATIRPSTK